MTGMTILDPAGLTGWSRYLAAGERDARTSLDEFQQAFLKSHAGYGQVSFPPPLFDAGFLASAGEVAARLVELASSLPERIFDGNCARMLRFQGMRAQEATLIGSLCSSRLLRVATQFARPDLLVCNSGLKAVELNISPAIGGLGLCDRITAEFLRSPYGRYLADTGIRLCAPDIMAGWGSTLREFMRSASAPGQPVLYEALVDPEELQAPYFFHDDFVRCVEEQGLRVETGLLQSLRVESDGVYSGRQRVNVIYTMFTYSEFLSFGVSHELLSELVAADEKGLVDFFSPPIHALFDSKANLALLTSDEFASHFSAEERRFIQAHVPKTLRLTPEVVQDAIDRRQQYVLKPTSEFGGAAVHVGADLPDDEWARRVREAASSRSAYVLQDRVDDLWTYQTHTSSQAENWAICLGPMVFGHRHSGSSLRQAPHHGNTPIINNTRGALVGTAFSAQPRSTH